MKHFLIKYISLIFMACIILSCKNNENEIVSQLEIAESDLAQEFDVLEDSKLIPVVSSGVFTVSSDQDWCNVTVGMTENSPAITISVTKNDNPARTAKITLGAKGAKNIVIAVNQQGIDSYASDISLSGLLMDNMVLQRETDVKIGGKATPGKKVGLHTSWNNRTYIATADEAGTWQAQIQTTQAGGPFFITVSGNAKTVKLNDVMLGDVWICSGQSNMEMPMGQVPIYGFTFPNIVNAMQEIAKANYRDIRFIQLKRTFNQQVSDQPETAQTSWQICSNATVSGFSAVAYFFARNIYENQKIPIGLIQSTWGGSIAEAWVSEESLKTMPDFTQAIERMKSLSREEIQASHYPDFPSIMYNAMIHPIRNFPIKGAIWYQGESNVGRAEQYKKLLPLLINDWRKAWGYDFPFYYVQLANFMTVTSQPVSSQWAEIREAQLQTLQVANTGMAVAIDIGEANDIHPRNKQDVGLRLAINARAKTYGENITPSGPLYTSHTVEGNKIRIRFNHVDKGLKIKGGAPLKGFAVAPENKKFVWADAVVEGNEVVVSSSAIASPVAVRYAWGDNPVCNLYNEADLPASPFRTDNW